MVTRDDVLQAKRELAARLLPRGLEGRVVGRRPALAIAAAVGGAAANVHAVGIGRKVVDGKPTRERAVRLYVVQKLPASLLSANALLPSEIHGIPTDVIESPPAFAAPRRRVRHRRRHRAHHRSAPPPHRAVACSAHRQERIRPVIAGVSVAHRDVTAGTIAYFCRDPGSSSLLLLSNNHVLANVNRGAPGDPILQPGPADGGGPGDQIATLKRFVRIHLDGRTPNLADCAVGELSRNVAVTVEVCTVGAVRGTTAPVEGDRVRKHGRTTGYTEGVVTDESYDALVGMGFEDPSIVALFQDQLRIAVAPGSRAFGLGGDSGSLIVMQATPKAAGLYFAGPEDGSYGVANHIAAVLDALGVELA
jgi:hypothetical protein